MAGLKVSSDRQLFYHANPRKITTGQDQVQGRELQAYNRLVQSKAVDGVNAAAKESLNMQKARNTEKLGTMLDVMAYNSNALEAIVEFDYNGQVGNSPLNKIAYNTMVQHY